MPSSSKKQHNFMAAVAHSPSFAKKVGVPQSVGKDFTEADKGKKFMNPRARSMGGKIKKMAGGGNAIGTLGKGGKRLSKANWNTWEPLDEEAPKSLTPSDSFDEDVESEAVAKRNKTTATTATTATTDGNESVVQTQKETPTKKETTVVKKKVEPKDDTPSYTPPKSHRTTGAGSSSYKPTSSFLANMEKDKSSAVSSALSRNPKLSAPKDEPLEESHPEDLLGVGKAVAGLGTVAALTKKFGPKILSSMGKIGSNVERRAAAKAAEEAAENSSSRLSRLSKPLKEASKKSKEASDAYKGSGFRQHTDIKVGDTVKPSYNPNADRGYFKQWNIKAGDKMRTGGKVDKVKAYAKGGSVRGGGCESKGKTRGKFR